MKLRTYSIRLRLLVATAFVIILATAIQVGIAYQVALREVGTISDYHMTQIAHAVRHGLLEPPGQADLNDTEASRARSFFLVVTPLTDSSMVGQPNPANEAHPFSMRQIGQRTFRVFTLYTKTHKVEILQDRAIRSRNARRLALHTVTPALILAPILLLLVWWGISLGLTPLARSRREIARRAPGDLRPLNMAGVPEELKPFIAEINILFERISEAFTAQQNFVGYAAHELRSPLTALRLQVQGLQRATSDETRQVATDRVIAGIDRATRLIDQILMLAREEASGASPERTNLPGIARMAVSDVLPLARVHKTDLGAKLPEEDSDNAFDMNGDAEALRVMLRNLLENAVKYSPESGIVNLLLWREADRLILTIEDNGPGIAADERELVFERFRRGSAQTSPGSGLGLSIVKAIADRHQISITLGHSKALGGLAVSLSIPAAPTQSHAD